MPPESVPEVPDERRAPRELLQNCLVLDLEVTASRRIFKLGAFLGADLVVHPGATSVAEGLELLEPLARRATAVVGHNLAAFDLPILADANPTHSLLRLPVIDTLTLSPIAFPQNPYHRLVKDYKLVRETLSDPVADARLTASLFDDELRALDGLRQADPDVFAVLHHLLGDATGLPTGAEPAAGLDLVFRSLGGRMPTRSEALGLGLRVFARYGCSQVPLLDTDLGTRERREALAFVVSWLRVAGSNSVLPPWVRRKHASVQEWILRLREKPCTAPECAYCRRTHDARAQLKHFFGFDDFRPTPANARGGSLQRDIIEAGIRDESLLAILPTGGGKSLCFQLPALVRNFRRGVLTIVISPLQALMKDQVDGLVRRTGTPFAAALYGLLTPPERGDVLRRVQLGDVAILYVSPEQLRNVSFKKAILQREIGCWVFDEAHCLSKWGHDFRPDYLYAGRFIRELAAEQKVPIPPVACVTATAKRDVKEEIVQFFRDETQRELTLYEGGVERTNLRFEVHPVTERGKLEHIHELLAERLPEGANGCAIVFRATRGSTEITSQYLANHGWRTAHFHAGLTPAEKKRIQDEFLDGQFKVICATNAFGMGIDKEDVRLVVHGDTPGSLENYLQEAGRAGRDGRTAECVLLYAEEDCERQFQLGALSQLSRRDIGQILRGLRKAARSSESELVITSGEILRDEEFEADIDAREAMADTKVRTAISWLERSGFVQRDENVTRVFQARPMVRSLEEARRHMAALNLPERESALWIAILRELLDSEFDGSLTVDQLALLPEFTLPAAPQKGRDTDRSGSHELASARIFATLDSMSRAGLLRRDTLLNAFVRHKVVDPSRQRLERLLRLDRKLVDLLATAEPDPEGWMPLSLREVNQRLVDDGLESTPDTVLLLLKSLADDGRGFAGATGSIELRHTKRGACQIRVRRNWQSVTELAEKRRRSAGCVLGAILARIPPETAPSADLLVNFTFEELRSAMEADLELRSEIKDFNAALERALMYLHEQRVIVLQQGLAVFRSAMKIKLREESRAERFKVSDYQPLAHHYGERTLQVHVMGEYARRGIEAIREALALVLAYFTVDKDKFVRRYLGSKPDLLKHATTAQSYQRIVTDLANPDQIRIVTAPVDRNLLILAGPGSGKTRTIVHRCAYLLRVERVRPHAILVCCFNRSAAIELRRRLRDLVGDDAIGVTIQTYHGLALRLLGRSLTPRPGAPASPENLDLEKLIPDAVRLLRGERVPAGTDPDEVRDRLLAGFQHILVDEYQDIDQPQYELIAALAGRTLDDPDQKLCILAVGDDDQNIYGFRGANVRFIRQFQADYDAEPHYLVENYRSTRHIIDAANQLISANSDRMKIGQPIRVDSRRSRQPAGGDFGSKDPQTGGRVQVLRVRHATHQAGAVLGEIVRLRELGVADLRRIAVLAETHADLAAIRWQARALGIPVQWTPDRGALPALARIREVRQFLSAVRARHGSSVRASSLRELVPTDTPSSGGAPDANPWNRFVARLLESWHDESGDAEVPAGEALDFLYETCADWRREFSQGDGVILSTVHAAKGTEHDHVLLAGTWDLHSPTERREELRRAFYVGMTRARQSLTIVTRDDVPASIPRSLGGDPVIVRDAASLPSGAPTPDGVTFNTLSLEDIHLGYPGIFDQRHSIHAALARLQPGSPLFFRPDDKGLHLANESGVLVARLSRSAQATWASRLERIVGARVLAMVVRSADQETDPDRRARLRVDEWEVPLVEVEWRNPRH